MTDNKPIGKIMGDVPPNQMTKEQKLAEAVKIIEESRKKEERINVLNSFFNTIRSIKKDT